jgi:hypothetical protein
MKRSWKPVAFAGIAARTAETVLGGITSVLALFVRALLHERRRAPFAKRFGVGTRDGSQPDAPSAMAGERRPEFRLAVSR